MHQSTFAVAEVQEMCPLLESGLFSFAFHSIWKAKMSTKDEVRKAGKTRIKPLLSLRHWQE